MVATTEQGRPRSLRLGGQLVVMMALAYLPLAAVLALLVMRDRREALEHSAAESLALAELVARRVDDLAERIDTLLSISALAIADDAGDVGALEERLRQLRDALPPYVQNIKLTSPDGPLIASSSGRRNSNQSDRKYFEEALRTGNLASGEPVVSRASGEWTLGLAKVVKRADGTVLGVLSVSLRLDRLGALGEALKLPAASVVTILDGDGVCLSRSLDPDRWVGRSFAQLDGMAGLLARRHGTSEDVEVDGVRRVAGFTTAHRLPWLVAVAVPQRQVFRDAEAAMLPTLSWSVGGALLSLAIGFVLARRVARPLQQLAEDARRFGGGALDHRTGVRGGREVATLAENFNAMAANLQRTNEDLERRVAARTRELDTANRELEAFNSRVSHDLHGPVRGIQQYCAILQEEHGAALGEDGRAVVDRVHGAAGRLQDLIEVLLRLSRVSQLPLDRDDVDLSRLAAEIVAELRARDPQRRVEVTIAPGLRLYGDRRLTRVLLENLIGNAWKFTARTAEPRIEIGAEPGAGGGRELFVRDNGAGFEMGYAPQLFNPFTRLHSAAEFPGHGIGLATVRRVAERHGGTVRAQGSLGHGATFWFSFAAQDAPLSPPPARSAPAAPGA